MITTSSFKSTVAPSETWVGCSLIASVPLIATSMIVSESRWRDAMQRHLRSEFLQARAKHTIKGWKWVDDVGERFERRTQLDRQHELAKDLTRSRRDKRCADQHSASPICDELECASVKIVDVAACGLGRISGGDDDVE